VNKEQIITTLHDSMNGQDELIRSLETILEDRNTIIADLRAEDTANCDFIALQAETIDGLNGEIDAAYDEADRLLEYVITLQAQKREMLLEIADLTREVTTCQNLLMGSDSIV
jgi:Mg2+ and Co2+ transporter CorA